MYGLNFEVKRTRFSVLQGWVDIYLDNKRLITIQDEIKLNDAGEYTSIHDDLYFIELILFPSDEFKKYNHDLYKSIQKDIKEALRNAKGQG